jgi:hypothetical protein
MALVFNDNFRINAGKPLDVKFGPYLSIQDANVSIPLPIRHNGLLFGVYENPSDIPNSDIIYYYYYGSFTDTEIKQFLPDGDKNFVHIQNIPSTTWHINHNLNKFPSVTVIDSANTEVEGDIIHINENQCQLIFSAAFSGKAIFN